MATAAKEYVIDNHEPISVKLIGLGGIGSIVARYASVLIGSTGQVATLTLIDGDQFEVNNATRMLFTKIGPKVDVVGDELSPLFVGSALSIEKHNGYIDGDNIEQLIEDDDIVIVAADNHKTRKIVSTRCKALDNACLISAGNDGVGEDGSGKKRNGTYGNCQYYLRESGADLCHDIEKYHPEIADPQDTLPHENCTEAITTQPQLLMANMTAASCILNTLWLHLCRSCEYAELSFQIDQGKMTPWKFKK